MEFKQFKRLFQNHVYEMLEGNNTLFVSSVGGEEIWNTYLNSFPPGTNEIFRERREHDCSCCHHFIKSFGNVVTIKDNQVVTIWDFKTGDSRYQPVVYALSAMIKVHPVQDVFVTKESGFGTDRNFEHRIDGPVHTWEHFRIDIPPRFITRSSESEVSLMGRLRDIRNVFQRSLEEISKGSIETVLDLISQNSLYKGEEWQAPLTKFLALRNEYHGLSAKEKDLYCWSKSVEIGGGVGKIRNHSIGVLLEDIAEGTDLDQAVRKYEAIVAPTNYKRPKSIFTKKMVEQAQQTLIDLGLIDSLGRRFATAEDITVNNILFANRDTLKKMSGNVFAELQKEVVINPKQFSKVEEIPIEEFIEQVLPRTTGIQVFLENRHSPNLVSVIAPENKDSRSLFKWNNGFSWAYSGNITDSMKERVKAAGGNVEGVLRFSLQWNEEGDNQNDFDAHCIEPDKNHIYFPNKSKKHPSTGMLDVDIVHPSKDQVAVENITWTSINRMQEGEYVFYVRNFSHRGGRSGFNAEIEYGGQIYSYKYAKELRQDEEVIVAILAFRNSGIKFIDSLPSSLASKKIWSLDTNQFHPVSVCMFSPNYWDLQTGIGHRHYFFILKGCLNDTSPNGFFNEFLREDLMQHKRVFEALGGKMRVESSDSQLSGLGFSSTKRNSLICKLEGHVSRVVKITF